MNLEQIRQRVARPATILTAGGFRPTNERTESWLARVFLFEAYEVTPRDSEGNELIPLAQLYLRSLPYVPACLNDVDLITVFISTDFPEEFEPMGERWVVRAYSDATRLVQKNLEHPPSSLKPFPLSASKTAEDWPHWDGGGLDEEAAESIVRLEKRGEISDYYDVMKHEYTHKVGGYPSFCQSGIDGVESFEFAFQISSDSKINLNVVDNGSLQFYRNRSTGDWKIYYDFY